MTVAAVKLKRPCVLIVDDEPSIGREFSKILQDEGFDTITAASGAEVCGLIAQHELDLIILDIWLPGRDGLEVLQDIKRQAPSMPVIMMSGHADIAAALKAISLGAIDFLEKPFSLEPTLKKINNALGLEYRSRSFGETFLIAEELRQVFSDQGLRGKRIAQRTLQGSGVLYGQGLHSGKRGGLILEPLPPGHGIHFVNMSSPGVAVPAHVSFVDSTGYATTIRNGGSSAATIEHLMSALHAYRISNILVKCNQEVPALDGSAREFCDLIDRIGVVDQAADAYEIAVKEKIRIGDDREYIEIEPAERLSVSYYLSYPEPIGIQQATFVLSDVAAYRSEIAPARTFNLLKYIADLQRQGLALGGTPDNCVLFDNHGPLFNAVLRFPDEPVRHKILDVIGDLYLLGRPVVGKITAHLTGHSDNYALAKIIARVQRQDSGDGL